jgi:glucokinase
VSVSVIGVDLGGTKIAVAGMCGPRVGDALVRQTDLSRTTALLDQIVAMVGEVRESRLDGVGIGVPSVVEFATGRVVSSVNVPLAEVPLRQVLGERIGVPVFVDNDATVAALAEAHDEHLMMVARDLVMITIGTGVGGGFVLGGRIYRGATGGAGEIGHTLVGLDLSRPVPAPARFPQTGSLEYAASGHALDRLGASAAADAPDSMLGRVLASGKPVLGPDVVEAALAGDRDARAIIDVWGQRIGVGVANAINTFDPEEVVIGGGGAQAGEMLLDPVRRVAAGFVLPGLGAKTTIRLARHGVRAGVLGAALLAEEELEVAAGVPFRSSRKAAARDPQATEVS